MPIHSVVFDAVVFVRSVLNPHSRWGRLLFAHTARYDLVVSKPILREITEVTQRPEITRKSRYVAGLDRNTVLAILANATIVEVKDVPAVSRDPKDDVSLATARAARAAFLVTEDDDLLVLGHYEGTAIVSASTYLAILLAADDV